MIMSRSWLALLLVPILVFAVSTFASSYAEVNNTYQTNTTVIKAEIGKTWLAINPIQCGENPWQKANQSIQDYYKSQGVIILDDKIVPWTGYAVCSACLCSNGTTLYTLVLDSDAGKMMKFGYVLATGDLTKDMTLAHTPMNYSNMTISTPEKTKIFSPLKQSKTGISLQDIKCNQGLVLVVKTLDNSPACVKSNTAQRLAERGWGKLVTPPIPNPTPTNPPSLSNSTTYFAGQKVGVFTILKINPTNVTGYYNSPYPLARPGPGVFTIMHIGDALNPTCDGSAPLVITAINYPDSITVSIGKSTGRPIGGCPICLSANSEIKTPNGDVNVKEIKDGMTVWSTDSNGMIIKSKVIKINNVFVGDTKIVDLQLADGRELFVSPNHPTYDGRKISDLKVGEIYDRSVVKSIELVQYKYQFTYDILPDSQTGDYFANGILVGSTLK
jgi:hypothetical protein